MGSVREETDILIGYLLEVLGKAPQILDDEGQSLVVTKVLRDQILSLVCKRIEGVELPVGSTGSIQEACRRAILREVRK